MTIFDNSGLTEIVERIERAEAQKAEISEDIKEIYTEAKSRGFDPKILRQIIRERKMDKADWEERETLLDTYRHALGMLADTPLGEAAIERTAKA